MPRYSESRGRRLSTYEAVVERLAGTPAGAWMFVNVLTRLDRRLLALTRGRWSMTPRSPVGLLETTGARSGLVRHTPLLYLAHGDVIALVASNGGSERHPAGLLNLRAHADVRFLSGEHGWRSYTAREATGADRDSLWTALCDLYAGYGAYAARAGGRTIPVVVLEPPSDRGLV